MERAAVKKKARKSAGKTANKKPVVEEYIPEQRGDFCPICKKTIVVIPCNGSEVDCNPQRRLVVFAGPYDGNGLPIEPLQVFTERQKQLVIGRAATDVEKKRYKAKRNPGAPFTIGFEAHWRTCKGKQ